MRQARRAHHYRDIIQLTSFPNAAKDNYGRLLVGAALGITPDCRTAQPHCCTWA